MKSHTRMGKEAFDHAMSKRPPEESKFMHKTRLVWQTRRLFRGKLTEQGWRELGNVKSDVLEHIQMLCLQYPEKTDEEIAELLLAEEAEKNQE